MITEAIVDQKSWTNLVARAALAGHQLYRTAAADGEVQYFCCRWGMVKALGTLDEVVGFLDRVTGAKA
ncbi:MULTISPECIES: hypothetical protein [unclassified Variovorax]|uniref:hypothetical protein n=1 Tax=unclassified Variovorax TaxID=663243 RepID=UPI00076CE211|nr:MULTISPECIES: hypothetical protein [unclassified Variovorax]KWT64458.1 hypothetical protein APY03_7636 [Variovorax sp. WDL1]PNG56330.1 hypothetical protein CHC07_02745 [Variovorax sp. B4]PNG57754.1 hypothetical protein CHC06_02748 [Variovorax sp. B2]VTV09813.1 hypothetical protein WDL1CHR_00881 [Variovorax sp. WDL1]